MLQVIATRLFSVVSTCILVVSWKVVLLLSLFPKDVVAGIILYYQVSPYFLHIALSQSIGTHESCDELLRDGVFLILC